VEEVGVSASALPVGCRNFRFDFGLCVIFLFLNILGYEYGFHFDVVVLTKASTLNDQKRNSGGRATRMVCVELT
jgi:hypothetical protein